MSDIPNMIGALIDDNKVDAETQFKQAIAQKVGDALKIIPEIEEKFDLVFIDADKQNYPNYFELIVSKMNAGGLILSDNVLWSGAVADLNDQDKNTLALRELNEMLYKDNRIELSMIPVGDGLTIVRKKE